MLSTETTGLYTSERHQAAKEEGKLTAGQMARKINRAVKLTPPAAAAELKPLAAEWHHSGFMPGGGMGRTYFFPPDADARTLAEQVAAARVAPPTRCWQVRFRADRGAYGRKHYVPIAHVFELDRGKVVPTKAERISRELYDSLLPFEGQDLEPYESLYSFLARKTTAVTR